MSSADCLNACSRDCFSILDTARTKHPLRIKESLFISWLKTLLMCTTDDEVYRLRNMFCKIKYIVFKIRI